MKCGKSLKSLKNPWISDWLGSDEVFMGSLVMWVWRIYVLRKYPLQLSPHGLTVIFEKFDTTVYDILVPIIPLFIWTYFQKYYS